MRAALLSTEIVISFSLTILSRIRSARHAQGKAVVHLKSMVHIRPAPGTIERK